jgi:hypothetical protein
VMVRVGFRGVVGMSDSWRGGGPGLNAGLHYVNPTPKTL